jgi:hypothetical protein
VIARGNVCSVDRQRDGIDIDEDWFRAQARDAPCRRKEGKRGRDHFIAWSDAQGHERHENGVSAGRHPDRVRDPESRGHFGLQLFHLRAHHELLGIADARHRRQHFVADGRILKLKIEQWNLHGHWT